MGKIREIFNNIGYIKGTFYARMGTIKDRNGKDITETEEIKTVFEGKYSEHIQYIPIFWKS